MISLRFASQWSPFYILALATLAAMLAWWLYRRELRKLDVGSAAWVLPTLRALAILLILLTLAEPIIESRRREGEPGRVLFLLDSSESMSFTDSSELDAPSRFERATQHLINPNDGLLSALSEEFEISAQRFDSPSLRASGGNVRLWESSLAELDDLPASATDWLPESWGRATAVGDVLARSKEVAENATNAASAVVVVLTDGQSNMGQSPIAAATELATAEVPVFVVGYGPADGLPDLSLVAVETPSRVYRTDLLQGTITIDDQLPEGEPFVAELLHADEIIWKQALIADGKGNRTLSFNVPIEPLFAADSEAIPRGVEYATLPVKLTARLVASALEANTLNNQREIHLSVASQKSRLLLVDGRSRWETRYLRNVFSRDPAWEIDMVLAHSTDRSLQELLQSREDFQKYNVVILGDADASIWEPEQLTWLREYVERGGGLIMIDGARQHLQDAAYDSIAALLPVRWKGSDASAAIHALPKTAELTSAGAGLEALKLVTSEKQDNGELWRQLPALQFMAEVEPLPGSEVLIKGISDIGDQPLLITRRFGAGRVLFLSTDETWRWRYKVADLVHQRFWNQLARWAMQVPMSVQGEFVSLDTGAASVNVGQKIEVKCILRGLDGSIAPKGRAATAIVRRLGKVIARIPMEPRQELPGAYSGEIPRLPAGEYEVQIEAAGYPKEALEVTSKFTVLAPQSQEMQKLACNEPLLVQLAELTGGEYLPERDVGELAALLRPISGGKITQSATILWQSYWWFVAALLLLVAEWILRKRNGLI